MITNQSLFFLVLLMSGSVTAQQTETFEQMCTKKVMGYGNIVSIEKMKTKREGFNFVVTENGRKKTAVCTVSEEGVLIFNVKDVK